MTSKALCSLCEKPTDDNYIGGEWVCSKCYPKFKKVFEAYIVFVDEDKLHELIRERLQTH